eukprot:5663399-Pyramimonas_sp.AAC.1
MSKVDLSPGPDGAPRSAWQCPLPLIKQALWPHYLPFTYGQLLSPEFNLSKLAFLPEGARALGAAARA